MPRAWIVATLILIGAGGCAHASSSGGASAPAQTLPVTSGDYPAYGHAPDFAWVAGRLVRSSPAGQCEYVVFSTRTGEPWGGRLALASPSGSVARFPGGDMVVVTGSLDPHALSLCGDPVLTVRTIEEH